MRLVQSAGVRTEYEPRSLAPAPHDLDAEREVDFGRVGRTILSRWWLVAAAVALGALAGYLSSLGGGDVYQAKTTLYLGQPISPNGVQIQSLATNPATVSEVVRSEEVVRAVGREIGVEPQRLRRGIATKALAPSDAARRQQQGNPLVEISVQGPWGNRTARAADLLAAAAIKEVSAYVDVKL